MREPIRLTRRGQRLVDALLLLLCIGAVAGFTLWWIVAYSQQP